MISTSRKVPREMFERDTGWLVKPEGACKAEICVPLPEVDGDQLDLAVLSQRLGMPLVHDPARGLFSLGPESGGRALGSAVCPDLRLPDWQGNTFDLATLRGRKVLLLAWASW